MRRECPEWFQDRLTRVGGTNKYGQPNFKLVWGQYETFRVGGYFAKDGFVGYRDMPTVGEACWAIMMWEPAEMQGSADRWYWDYRDEFTGLCDLGQFPYHGRYRLLQKLVHHELVGSEMVTVRMEPNNFIIDVMVPLIILWQRMTNEAKVAAIKQEMDIEQEQNLKRIKDSRAGYRVRRGSALVQKKVEQIERGMKQAMKIASRSQLGLRQD